MGYRVENHGEHVYRVETELEGVIKAGPPGSQDVGMQEMPVKGNVNYTMTLQTDRKRGRQEVTVVISDGQASVSTAGMPPQVQAVPEATLKYTLTEQGKVLGVEGLESIALDSQYINARHFLEMMSQILPQYPVKGAWSAGSRWAYDIDIDVPGGQQPVKGLVQVLYAGDEPGEGGMQPRLVLSSIVPVNMTRNANGAMFSINGQDRVESAVSIERRTGLPLSADVQIAYQAKQRVTTEVQDLQMVLDLRTRVRLARLR